MGKETVIQRLIWRHKTGHAVQKIPSKGTANVLAESTLLAIARNINKLHNKIQNGKTGTHLFPLKSA